MPLICNYDLRVRKWFSALLSESSIKYLENGRSYLKCRLDNKKIWVDFAEIMLPKFCVDMLHNQINCNVIVTSSRNDHIGIFL